MKSLALKILSLCVFDIKDDIIIKAFQDIGLGNETEAFSAYGNICRELFKKNCTLSDYIKGLLLETEMYSSESSHIEYDLSVIRELCSYDSVKIKDFLSEKFGEESALSLPDFENGSFNSAEDILKIRAITGTGGFFSKYKAFIAECENILPISFTDPIKLSDLKEYGIQKQQIVQNTECFLKGGKAQNVLLYGDRGTGKSSTVKALINHYENLRIIGADKNYICYLPKIFDKLRNEQYKFIVFLDDLVFEAGDGNYNTLKQILEGSVALKPENVLIYATTNRRHIIKETVADRDRDSFHRGDALDDNVSLSDRFGLYVTYSLPDKELYMKIIKQLASESGLLIEDCILEKRAEQYALKRGGRSPRMARQFIELLSAENELKSED